MKAGLVISALMWLMLTGCVQTQPQGSVPQPTESQATSGEAQAIATTSPDDQVCPLPPPCTLAEPVECPPPKVIEKVVIKSPAPPATAGELNLPIIGEVEDVRVEPPGLVLEARIDTGAESSSMHAENIQLVERDGKSYVRFAVLDPKTNKLVDMERKRHRTVRIKRQSGDYERRYVIKLWLSMGSIKEMVDVTLTDRSDFEYPLLVGRNLLTDTAIVDVSRKHTLK
ncbi:MAG: hypothetical protein EP323_09525 [Gammaproteobacteria bacterium]|nr:MAG: hypothetical protein EP323_09525 [Gammaproteobacteria bacterium]